VLREIAILHAPSPLGLMPPAEGRIPGVRFMPDALERAGLHQVLGAAGAGTVEPPDYNPARDPGPGVRNLREIAEYSVRLADAIDGALAVGRFLLVLGGDCSILLGATLALRRRVRFGVVYADAHSDCQTPEISNTGGVAGMPLAIATGRTVELLANLEGLKPYVREEDAVLVGCRDLFDIDMTGTPHVQGTGIRVHDLDDVRRCGPAQLGSSLAREMEASSVDGFWVHVDADVLDERIMPAVDSPEPDGLSADELTALLAPLLASPRAVGMQVTIYDPERDTDGRAARVLVQSLAAAFGRPLAGSA
jgi:arginase